MEEELRMLELLQHSHPVDRLEAVASADEIVQAQSGDSRRACRSPGPPVPAANRLRDASAQRLGAGGQPASNDRFVPLFAKRWRPFAAATFVLPDDVKKIIAPVMNHRLIVRPESRLRKVTAEKVIDEIVGEIAVPTIEAT